MADDKRGGASADEGEGLVWDLRALAGGSEIGPQLAELARGLGSFHHHLRRNGFTREEATGLVELWFMSLLEQNKGRPQGQADSGQ